MEGEERDSSRSARCVMDVEDSPGKRTIPAADYLNPDQGLTLSAIARSAGANVGDVSRSLQLGFLAPDLVEAMLDGT